MSDPGPLLVPIQVDAMALVGRSGRAIRRPQMIYDNVEDFTTPEPQPFGDPISQTPDELGVYLMWTLPAALRHGTQKQAGSGAVEFPFVPNRWLVIRILTQPGAPAAATSWIVESDALDDGTSPYLDANMTATQVGAKRDADTWTEPGAKGAPFLRAVAPGNPAFAAFQPHNENVFSIKDDLNGIDSGTLDYFVAGWYAGDGDPLGDRALDSLNWDAPDPAHPLSVFHISLPYDSPPGNPPYCCTYRQDVDLAGKPRCLTPSSVPSRIWSSACAATASSWP